MREFKTAAILCFCVIVLGIAGFSIWSVRQYLPLVGVILLIVIIVGALLALAWGIEHTLRRFSRFEYKAIDQYGTVARRYNSVEYIAPQIAARVERITIDERGGGSELLGPADEDEMEALPAPILTFSQLLEQGIIQAALQQGKMVLGYYADTGELRYGSWLDLYSCGIGGVSGSGKSTTVRFLLFQAIMASARFIMVDPHIGDEEESLAAQFRAFPVHQFPPCDASVKAVLKRVQWLKREFQRRKATGIKTPFTILVIDEFNAVMRVKEIREEVSDLLLEIEQEARKFGIFAMLLAQRWSAQDLGGADIRTSLASLLAHRFTDEDQARKLVGSRNGPRCLELGTGHWLFRDTKGGLKEMFTPETYSQDGAMVARFIGVQAVENTPETTWKPRENTTFLLERATAKVIPMGLRNYDETSDFEAETSEETTEDTSRIEELARAIVKLQAEGKQKPEIMRTIWKVNPGASEAYKTAQEEYQLVMSFIAEQLGA